MSFVQSESTGGGLDSAETVVPGQSRDPKKGKNVELMFTSNACRC